MAFFVVLTAPIIYKRSQTSLQLLLLELETSCLIAALCLHFIQYLMCPNVKPGGSVGLRVKYEDLKYQDPDLSQTVVSVRKDKAFLTLCKSKELKEHKKTCP